MDPAGFNVPPRHLPSMSSTPSEHHHHLAWCRTSVAPSTPTMCSTCPCSPLPPARVAGSRAGSPRARYTWAAAAPAGCCPCTSTCSAPPRPPRPRWAWAWARGRVRGTTPRPRKAGTSGSPRRTSCSFGWCTSTARQSGRRSPSTSRGARPSSAATDTSTRSGRASRRAPGLRRRTSAWSWPRRGWATAGLRSPRCWRAGPRTRSRSGGTRCCRRRRPRSAPKSAPRAWTWSPSSRACWTRTWPRTLASGPRSRATRWRA
mmetsp:Transcript_11514/g.32133  ORF Transcript_11514/g.32133 Transcript_11514/m.32133 type:complete len:260 (+) Transcript_11514:342-1121(+)